MITITTTLAEGDGTAPKNVGIDATVMFDASTNTGNSFEWEIVSKPESSNAVLTSPVTSITRLGPLDVKGVYHVRLWINRNAADQKSRMVSVSVPSIVSPLAAPSAPAFEAGGGRVRNWSFELPGVLPGYASDWVINDEAGILASQGGVTRGRSIPTNFTPTSGRYAMVIGDDLCLDDTFPVGAKFEVSQEVDLTNINQLELDARVKLCPAGPACVGGPWDCWWYFDGVNDAMYTLDAPVWEWHSNHGTWMVGMRPTFSGDTTQYLLEKELGYRQFITFNGGNPGGNPRVHRADVNRVGGAGWVNDANQSLQFPGEDTLITGRWTQGPPQCSYGRFYDSTGFTGGFSCGGGNSPTNDDTHPLAIGARRPLGPIAGRFQGRIYFAAWWKGTNIPHLTMQSIYNGITHPQDVVPAPNFYIDMSQGTPRANYISETGGFNWTVVGSPMLNGP